MNMRIFLFTVVLFIATISLSPVNNADAGIGFKQKIYASGFGAYLEFGEFKLQVHHEQP